MRDQVLWRKTGRIAILLAERLNIDTERALDLRERSAVAERPVHPRFCSTRTRVVILTVLMEIARPSILGL